MSEYPEPSFHDLYGTAYQIVDRIFSWYIVDLRPKRGPPQVAEVAAFLAKLTILMQPFNRELDSTQDSPLERQINASRQHKPVELFGVHTNALRAVLQLAEDVLRAAMGGWITPPRKLDKASREKTYGDLLRGPCDFGDNSRKWKTHCKRLMATLSAIDFQRIQTTLSLELAAAELFLKEHQTNAGMNAKSAGDDAAGIGGTSPARQAQPAVLRGRNEGPPTRQAKPVWNKETRELWWGDRLVKKYKKSPAPNQVKILDAFQAADWAATIENPFQFRNALNVKKRAVELKTLNDTVRCLNKSIDNHVIRFELNGANRVEWRNS